MVVTDCFRFLKTKFHLHLNKTKKIVSLTSCVYHAFLIDMPKICAMFMRNVELPSSGKVGVGNLDFSCGPSCYFFKKASEEIQDSRFEAWFGLSKI